MRTRIRAMVLSLVVAAMCTAGCGTQASAGRTSKATATITITRPQSSPTTTPTTISPISPPVVDPAALGWSKSAAPEPDAVAASPSAPGTLYTCTGATGQYTQGPLTLSVSTDNGATWKTRETGIQMARCLSLALSATAPQASALYASTCRSDCGRDDESLYYTLDGGDHWASVAAPPEGGFNAIYGWVGTTLFANLVPDGIVPGAHAFLATSRDGGPFAWTSLPAAPMQIFSAGSTLYVAAASSATCTAVPGNCADLYRSTDLGASWSRVTPAYQGNNVRPVALTPDGTTFLGFDARAFSGPNVYPLLRSADGGATWRALPDLGLGMQALTDAPIATPDGALYATFIASAATGPHPSGVYALTTGATVWTLASPSIPAQIRLAAALSPGTPRAARPRSGVCTTRGRTRHTASPISGRTPRRRRPWSRDPPPSRVHTIQVCDEFGPRGCAVARHEGRQPQR